MSSAEDPRYVIVFDKLSSVYIVIDGLTGEKLKRTDAAAEADEVCATFNQRHEAEQERIRALARAAGRKL